MRTSFKPFPMDRIDSLESDIACLRSLRNNKTRMVETAADLCNIPLDMLKGEIRTKEAAHKRFRAYYLLHRLGYSYPHIGRLLNRDHSSVMYGVGRAVLTIASHNDRVRAA